MDAQEEQGDSRSGATEAGAGLGVESCPQGKGDRSGCLRFHTSQPRPVGDAGGRGVSPHLSSTLHRRNMSFRSCFELWVVQCT